MPPATTIVTLRMDVRSQAFFDALRRTHYPTELNRIGAHLALFHTLPEAAWVREVLRREARAQAEFVMQVTGLKGLGCGVAYRLASDELMRMHQRLAAKFSAELTAQDRQRFQPHVVIQNKVTAAAARELLAKLERDFAAFEVRATGLEWWRYLGGPWELLESFSLTAVAGSLTPPVE